mmetsp:Transcript_94333/g.236830  ORF Transcript_94333/g.236830 Transcript_94333/m.236830 type:complete len:324 (-) Transcript_94333:53-1024(-)
MAYEELLRSMREMVGEQADGTAGGVDVRLSLPDSTELHGKFPEFVPVAAIFAFALATPWARSARPAGIRLTDKASRRELDSSEAISRDLHRAAIVVSTGPPPPATPSAALPVATPSAGVAQHTTIGGEQHGATVAATEAEEGDVNEEGVAHIMNACGVDRATAVTTLRACGGQTQVAANRLLDGGAAALADSPPANQDLASAPAMAAAPAAPAFPDGGKILVVVQRTSATYEAARSALEATGWDVDAAVHRVQAAQHQAAVQQRRPPEEVNRHRSPTGGVRNQVRRSSSPCAWCGVEGEFPHFFLGVLLGGLSACAVGLCAAL